MVFINRDISNIKNVLLFGSIKGGVGKSTLLSNIAYSLSKLGKKVGILDADIHGLSQKKILNVPLKYEIITENKIVIPFVSNNIKFMSISFFLKDENVPILLRGFVSAKILEQLLYETSWGFLDYLLIDLPSGINDIQISIIKRISISGVISVTHRHSLSLFCLNRFISIFKKINIPILGIINNMCIYKCLNCGYENNIFGVDNISYISNIFNIDIIGNIPFSHELQDLNYFQNNNFDKKNIILDMYNLISERIILKT